MGMGRSFESGVELEDGFTFEEIVEVRPCGSIYPKGLQLNLTRVTRKEPYVAFYQAEPTPSGMSPAVIVTRDRDFDDSRFQPRYTVLTAMQGDRNDLGAVGKNPISPFIWGQKEMPYGFHPTVTCHPADRTETAGAIAKAAADVVFTQGAAIQCEVAQRLLNRERDVAEEARLVDDVLQLGKRTKSDELAWTLPPIASGGWGSGHGWIEFDMSSVVSGLPVRAAYADDLHDEGSLRSNILNWDAEQDTSAPGDVTMINGKLRIATDIAAVGQSAQCDATKLRQMHSELVRQAMDRQKRIDEERDTFGAR